MDYRAARLLLETLPSLEVKPGLDRVLRLLAHLGDPQHSFPAIHVAGTNGKGSVVAMLASVLEHAGYRVGRFTSPDLIDFRDRIAINGEWITEGALTGYVEKSLSVLAAGDDPPTLFETLAAIAFAHFAEQHVDIAVIEVGLGGRFDATNVVQPVLTILTSVGRDHMALLGNTVEEIAWEKVGIAKESVPLIVGDLQPSVERIVRDECARTRTPVVTSEKIGTVRVGFNWGSAQYAIAAPSLPQRLEIPLIASYQEQNLRIALSAIVRLRQEGMKIPEDAITNGLATVHWPGRFEIANRRPLIVLDGAHNLPAAIALCREIEAVFPTRDRRRLIFGILSDKEVEAIVRALSPLFPQVILTRSNSPRALAPSILAETAHAIGVPAIVTESVAEALSIGRRDLEDDDSLLITGSLTVVRDARPLLLPAGG